MIKTRQVRTTCVMFATMQVSGACTFQNTSTKNLYLSTHKLEMSHPEFLPRNQFLKYTFESCLNFCELMTPLKTSGRAFQSLTAATRGRQLPVALRVSGTTYRYCCSSWLRGDMRAWTDSWRVSRAGKRPLMRCAAMRCIRRRSLQFALSIMGARPRRV